MRRIEEVLQATGKVPELSLRSAKNRVGDDSDDLKDYFLNEGIITEKDLYQAVAKISGLEFVDLRGREIPPDALASLPNAFCHAERLIPIEIRGDNLFVGTPNPDNFRAMDEISASTIYNVSVVVVTPTELQNSLDLYLRSDDEIGKLSEEIEQLSGDQAEEIDDLESTDDEAPVVRFVNLLIAQAIQDRASDIHVEPGEKELLVRYRIDGVMHSKQKADKGIQNGVVSRLKIMSNIDIGEKRKPQDGRISVKRNNKTIDIRVVTLPTNWGEKVVMRILDHSNDKRSISSIEMSPHNEKIFTNAISKPHGMVLVTGPTGSGKALPLDTKIPTPQGYTTMRDIDKNDHVFGSDGKTYTVTSTSEIMPGSDIYQVVLSNGVSIKTDADHQWLISTDESRNIPESEKKERSINEYVKAHKIITQITYLSLEFDKDCGGRTSDELFDLLKKENVHYYRNSAEIEQSLHMMDMYGGTRKYYTTFETNIVEYPIVDALMALAGRIKQQHTVVNKDNTPVSRVTTSEMLFNGIMTDEGRYQYAVPLAKAVDMPESGEFNDEQLDEYGKQLVHVLSHADSLRHFTIDDRVLRTSVRQRSIILRQLISSDVCEHDDRHYSFTHDKGVSIVSQHIVEIIHSLGLLVHRISDGFFFDMTVEDDVFLPIDAWNYVVSVEKVDELSDVKCISVSSPDFTYLVSDSYVVTSNSTTIYTALGEVAKPTVNVVTVEDPVEKKIPGITQMQINNKAGMTFSNALRSILRADPDIVFLGEIRDEETAKIAVDASMTGHLVLSTLHTNGAPEAAARLSEMGVEPYLVGSSVTCVVAQRLARRLCNDCKVLTTVDPSTLKEIGFNFSDPKLFKPVGCNICSRTGYRGRVALTEVLEINEYLEPLIIAQKSANEIRREAEKYGFVSLKNDGWDKVAQGLTTIDEVLRVAA